MLQETGRAVGVLGVVQVRFASSRLLGKALAEIDGKPLLRFLLDRLQRARRLDCLVVATTVGKEDDAVADCAASAGVPVVRGEGTDVLARYRRVMMHWPSQAVIRITADNPFTDPVWLDRAVQHLVDGGFDYVYPRRLPVGTAVDVFNSAALAAAAAEATTASDREHINNHLLANPRRFRLAFPDPPPRLDRPDVRLTVDTPRDLSRVREIVRELRGAPMAATLEELVAAYDRVERNAKVPLHD